MAAKRTSELIPLCHPLALTGIEVELTHDGRAASPSRPASAPPGRPASRWRRSRPWPVAALTVYDMVKAVDKAMVIERCSSRRSRAADRATTAAPVPAGRPIGTRDGWFGRPLLPPTRRPACRRRHRRRLGALAAGLAVRPAARRGRPSLLRAERVPHHPDSCSRCVRERRGCRRSDASTGGGRCACSRPSSWSLARRRGRPCRSCARPGRGTRRTSRTSSSPGKPGGKGTSVTSGRWRSKSSSIWCGRG